MIYYYAKCLLKRTDSDFKNARFIEPSHCLLLVYHISNTSQLFIMQEARTKIKSAVVRDNRFVIFIIYQRIFLNLDFMPPRPNFISVGQISHIHV